MNTTHLLAALSATVVIGSASGEIVFDEAVDGDLSDNYLAPTVIEFTGAENTVVFSTDREGDDRDLFTFNVAEGFQLTGIVLDLFDTNSDEPGNRGFMGFSTGSVLGTDPDSPDPAELLGYALPAAADSGTDFITIMAEATGVQGYDAPLPSGDYTFWAQETSPTIDDWVITFVVSEVPGPGALALFGLAGVVGRRRRG